MNVCARSPLALESPCSWISRSALMNGVAPMSFMCMIGVSVMSDIDMAWASRARKSAIRACALKRFSFDFSGRMLKAVARVGLEDRLLLSHHGLPRYRFCRECLKEQPKRGDVHFPLHWRFSTYRWCTVHSKLLEDRCPECRALVILPANLLHAAEAGRRAQIDSCMVCGKKLTGKPTPTRFEGLQNFTSPEEARLLRNGLATLAALWRGFVVVDGCQREHLPLSALRRLELGGHLPTRPMRFDRFHLRENRYRQPWTNRVIIGSKREAEELSSGLFDGDFERRTILP